MSYLGRPRLNFAGTFQADVATTNNRPQYYDNALFEPRYQWRMNMPDINGLWNPGGPNTIRMTDVRITSGVLPDGRLVTSSSADPVVEGSFTDDDLRTNGKFVDLDPNDQMVPEIYGFRPRVLGADGTEMLRGDYVPTAMADLWPRAWLPSGRPDMSAMYQTVLTDLDWAEDLRSPLLRALRAATRDGLLSIKFTVDGVEDGIEHWPDDITFGRLVGSIGPYFSGEPRRFVAARRLRKTDPNGLLHHAPCRVDEPSRTVFVDLGNSVPAASRGGPLVELPALHLAALDDTGAPTVLAALEGIDSGFYERVAGIATAKLTPGQLAMIRTRRLALVDSAQPPAILLSENADGSLLQADRFVFRLFPGTAENSGNTTLYATRFGRPAAGVRVFLGGTPPPQAITLPSEVTTGRDGRAEVSFTGEDPGNPRTVIDGVTTKCAYGYADRPNEPEGTLSVRVFDAYRVPDRPTWVRDVQPIFQQYANLYPVMRHVTDLGNYDHVVRHKTYVRRTLLASRDSPNHMPVTRDLSPRKRDMIVKWLETEPAPPVLEIDTVEDLRSALHQAALVELAVMPPYLAALLSIKPDRNVAIAELIRGVAVEEMQHMAQVCNIINAIGGRPQIGRPALVPTYPGRLPGPVLPHLQVRLRKLSLEHVKDVFMAIEAPEHPMVDGTAFKGRVIRPDSVTLDRSGRVLAADQAAMRTLQDWFTKAEYRPQTIGWFYNQIARAIIRLDGGRLFTGDPARQVGWPDAPGTLYKVTDRQSALLGIYQIIEQGEGSPHDLDGDNLGDPEELGHYYRFQEIVEGRQLVRNAQGEWVHEGPEIPFDPDGVHPMIDDPDAYRLPPDSVGRRETERCNTSYVNVLSSLQRVFDGHPQEIDDAVGLMFQMQAEARKLCTIPFGDGPAVLGPAFQAPGLES